LYTHRLMYDILATMGVKMCLYTHRLVYDILATGVTMFSNLD